VYVGGPRRTLALRRQRLRQTSGGSSSHAVAESTAGITFTGRR